MRREQKKLEGGLILLCNWATHGLSLWLASTWPPYPLRLQHLNTLTHMFLRRVVTLLTIITITEIHSFLALYKYYHHKVHK